MYINSTNLDLRSGWSADMLAVQAFFIDTVLQTENDPTPLAVGSIRLGSVRALRSIMGETARRS